jgi:hypothetical protein
MKYVYRLCLEKLERKRRKVPVKLKGKTNGDSCHVPAECKSEFLSLSNCFVSVSNSHFISTHPVSGKCKPQVYSLLCLFTDCLLTAYVIWNRQVE